MRRSCTVADAAAVAAEVRATVPAAASVAEEVAEILEGVRLRGNAGVAEYERRFGGDAGFDAGPSGGGPFRVTPSRLAAALEALAPDVRQALKLAAANIAAVAAAGLDAGELLDWPGVPLMFSFVDFDGNRFYVSETSVS